MAEKIVVAQLSERQKKMQNFRPRLRRKMSQDVELIEVCKLTGSFHMSLSARIRSTVLKYTNILMNWSYSLIIFFSYSVASFIMIYR